MHSLTPLSLCCANNTHCIKNIHASHWPAKLVHWCYFPSTLFLTLFYSFQIPLFFFFLSQLVDLHVAKFPNTRSGKDLNVYIFVFSQFPILWVFTSSSPLQSRLWSMQVSFGCCVSLCSTSIVEVFHASRCFQKSVGAGPSSSWCCMGFFHLSIAVHTEGYKVTGYSVLFIEGMDEMTSTLLLRLKVSAHQGFSPK